MVALIQWSSLKANTIIRTALLRTVTHKHYNVAVGHYQIYEHEIVMNSGK